MQFPEMEQKIEEEIFVLKIIAFESGAANSYNPERDTCHRKSCVNKHP